MEDAMNQGDCVMYTVSSEYRTVLLNLFWPVAPCQAPHPPLAPMSFDNKNNACTPMGSGVEPQPPTIFGHFTGNFVLFYVCFSAFWELTVGDNNTKNTRLDYENVTGGS